MTVQELLNMLMVEEPSKFLRMENVKKVLFNLIPDLKHCDGFKQNSVWHPYDVYEHIIRVVDGVPADINLRLAALFHDIKKYYVYDEELKEVDINESEPGVTYKVVDGKKYKVIGHFPNHWLLSANAFMEFAGKHHLENISGIDVALIEKLIRYHDIRKDKIDEKLKKELAATFTVDEIDMLYELRDADLRAQAPRFYTSVHEDHKIEIKILKETILRKQGASK